MYWARVGSAVVELAVDPSNSAGEVHKTRGKGHYTLIVEPAVLLGLARLETCHVVQ
jgi:hypothetical protein